MGVEMGGSTKKKRCEGDEVHDEPVLSDCDDFDPEMGEFEDLPEGDELEEVIVEGEEDQLVEENVKEKVFRLGIDKLAQGESLEAAPGSYKMLHRCQADWPCLSFDTITDGAGASRKSFPMSCYVVAGTQADSAQKNRIVVMKWSNLCKTDEGESEDDEESDDEEAAMDFKMIKHRGGVNRIRAMPQTTVAGSRTSAASPGTDTQLVAVWSDLAHVSIYDIGQELLSLDRNLASRPDINRKPLFVHKGHETEGFGLCWNPHEAGQLLSGDCQGHLFRWAPRPGGWFCNEVRMDSYGSCRSVEDLQFQTSGQSCQHIFASCHIDGSIKIWDSRELGKGAAINIANAHDVDCNVISWNPSVGELLLSGADDGTFKVWDIRYHESGSMAKFEWHREQITSVDWHPSDETVLAVASADNTVSLWDMSVEQDPADELNMMPGAEHYPAQLLFLHQGQEHIKEIKFHPQLPGVLISTASDGFNVFKTCNID